MSQSEDERKRGFGLDLHIVIYRLILSTIAALFALSLWSMMPKTNPGSLKAWIDHFTSLPFWNWAWVLSLPTYFILITLKNKKEFASYFLKMFVIVLAIMALPTFYAIRGAFDQTVSREFVFFFATVIWISLGLIGAYWAAHNKYLKLRRQKKKKSWKRYSSHESK